MTSWIQVKVRNSKTKSKKTLESRMKSELKK